MMDAVRRFHEDRALRVRAARLVQEKCHAIGVEFKTLSFGDMPDSVTADTSGRIVDVRLNRLADLADAFVSHKLTLMVTLGDQVTPSTVLFEAERRITEDERRKARRVFKIGRSLFETSLVAKFEEMHEVALSAIRAGRPRTADQVLETYSDVCDASLAAKSDEPTLDGIFLWSVFEPVDRVRSNLTLEIDALRYAENYEVVREFCSAPFSLALDCAKSANTHAALGFLGISRNILESGAAAQSQAMRDATSRAWTGLWGFIQATLVHLRFDRVVSHGSRDELARTTMRDTWLAYTSLLKLCIDAATADQYGESILDSWTEAQSEWVDFRRSVADGPEETNEGHELARLYQFSLFQWALLRAQDPFADTPIIASQLASRLGSIADAAMTTERALTEFRGGFAHLPLQGWFFAQERRRSVGSAYDLNSARAFVGFCLRHPSEVIASSEIPPTRWIAEYQSAIETSLEDEWFESRVLSVLKVPPEELEDRVTTFRARLRDWVDTYGRVRQEEIESSVPDRATIQLLEKGVRDSFESNRSVASFHRLGNGNTTSHDNEPRVAERAAIPKEWLFDDSFDVESIGEGVGVSAAEAEEFWLLRDLLEVSDPIAADRDSARLVIESAVETLTQRQNSRVFVIAAQSHGVLNAFSLVLDQRDRIENDFVEPLRNRLRGRIGDALVVASRVIDESSVLIVDINGLLELELPTDGQELVQTIEAGEGLTQASIEVGLRSRFKIVDEAGIRSVQLSWI